KCGPGPVHVEAQPLELGSNLQHRAGVSSTVHSPETPCSVEVGSSGFAARCRGTAQACDAPGEPAAPCELYVPHGTRQRSWGRRRSDLQGTRNRKPTGGRCV